MGFFDKIASMFRTKSASVPLLSPVSSRTFFGMRNNKSNAEYYRGWVYGCISKIKDEVAKIELHLERQDKQGNMEIIYDHPAITLLEFVNSFFTKYTLFERLQADLELYGNHYWLIERNGKGVPAELYPLFPTNIEAISDPEHYVSAYRYVMDGTQYTIPAENIIHFKTYNPSSFTVGLSTIEATRVSVDTDESAKLYNRQFFENSATPGIILEYPGTLNAETMDRMRQQWDEQYRGFKKAYRTAVAAGGLKIHQMEYKQSDMQFIEQRKFSRDEICALFGVPPTILGINEATVYAAAKAAEYSFAKFTIEPKLSRIIDTLNEFYIKLFPDSEGMKFKFTSTVPRDQTEQVAYYTAGILNGFLSLNDVRRMEQLPELEDGESVFLPLSLVPYGKPAVKAVHEKPSIKKNSWIKNMVSSAIKEIAVSAEPKIANKWTAKEFEIMGVQKIKGRNARTAGYEKLFKKTANKLFADQQKRVLNNLNENSIKRSMLLDSVTDPILRKFKVTDIFNEEAEKLVTINLFAPLFAKVTEEEGRNALEALGLNPDDFSINTPTMQEFLKKNTKLFAGTLTQTTSDGIRDAIVAGLNEGEGIVGIQGRIENYSGFDEARSEMIARTETIRAQGEAEQAAWVESKVVLSKVWFTAEDERVCPECGPLHGTEVGTEEAFLSEEEMQSLDISVYDGATDAPPLHPQCRCTLIPVVK